jgi:TonB-dependent starch-binding outer membrane protein SusC
MRNSGFETMLRYDVFSRPGLRWTTSVNGSLNSNRLVSLSDDVYQTDDCFNAGHTGEPIQISTHRVCVGERIGNFFGYESVGINEQGEWLILDQDDEVISIRDATSDDRRVLGNGLARYNLAWNNSARLGSFDLSVNMRGAFGFQVLNFQRLYYENPTVATYNMLRSAFDPVYGETIVNENGDVVPRTVNWPLAFVSYYVEDGDYWKIDNATLGYTFRPESLGPLSGVVSNARVYVTGRNLLTITGYKGMDPEVPINFGNDGILAAGTDHRDQYPTTRTYSFGVNLTF